MRNELEITSIDIYKSDIELKEPFRISIMEITAAHNLFVKINTNEGIYGIGETSPICGISGDTQSISLAGAPDLARLLLHKNPLNIEERMGEINRFLAHNSSLKSAFDMALYDLLGKAAGLPLYAVLGGGRRFFWTDNTVGLGDPDYMAQKAVEIKEQGFRAIKIKLGETFSKDVERVTKIRKAIGDDLPMRLDANQGWDYRTAVRILQTLEPMGIEYCEQPVAYWDYENMRRIRQNTTIGITADESLFDHHDAFKLASMGCCDKFNIKLSKSGGIHAAIKINGIAEGAGIPCMIGSMMETRVGLSAAAHLAYAKPNIRDANLDSCFSLKEDPVIGGVQYKVGDMILPDTPGHGADIDPVFLTKCECTTVE